MIIGIQAFFQPHVRSTMAEFEKNGSTDSPLYKVLRMTYDQTDYMSEKELG